MKEWIINQQKEWMAYLPPEGQRGWLERQIAKYLDYYNKEWMNPLRQYLFVYWIWRIGWNAIRGNNSIRVGTDGS